MSLEYSIAEVNLGFIGAAVKEDKVAAVVLPCDTKSEVKNKIRKITGEEAVYSTTQPNISSFLRDLDCFLKGEITHLNYTFMYIFGTDFQHKVWEIVREIQYGETRSYKWVSEKLKKKGAARAVGQALSVNPVPILVPCHRVISNGGGIGGFTGGVQLKERLLDMEKRALLKNKFTFFSIW